VEAGETDRSLLRIPPRHQEAVTGEQGAGKQAQIRLPCGILVDVEIEDRTLARVSFSPHRRVLCPVQPYRYFQPTEFGEKRSAEQHPNCRSSTEGGEIKIPAAWAHRASRPHHRQRADPPFPQLSPSARADRAENLKCRLTPGRSVSDHNKRAILDHDAFPVLDYS